MAFYLSCVVIGTAPVYFAAVQAWVWSFYAAAMMLAYVIFRWEKRPDKAKASWLWILLGGIFFIWTLRQKKDFLPQYDALHLRGRPNNLSQSSQRGIAATKEAIAQS